MANNKPVQNSNIKVMVKIRPLITREIESGEEECWKKISDTEIVELQPPTPAKPHVYDRVFGGSDTTQAIYDKAISHIVDSCVQGFNGSVMAYGQTSSGKTYTMMGEESNPGLIRLVAENIFDIVEQHDDKDIYMVRCSFLEIYNEKVNDLLAPAKTNLEVFETEDGAVMIKEATERVVRKATNMIELIEQGNAAKVMGETAANDRSSRSHTIFRIMIESQEEHDDGTTIKMGILDLVDLAGSESVSKNGATGDRLKEGISINKSLMELGRVIQELSEKKEGEDKFISYRNSKLTRVIQHSLGGNAKSVVICTVSPAEREETKNTLRFASRAQNVKNSPKLNEVISDQAMIKRLNERINTLRKRIDEMARNQGAEMIRKDIIASIEKCEMQFIRSKKSTRRQERRRQTWHCTANQLETRQDSNETEQDSLRVLMPPPPPIFTMQRGSYSVNNYERAYEMPVLDTNEKFEPGETVSFTRTPSPNHHGFPHRLSAIMEAELTPPCETCYRCKELEMELEELSEFTKYEEEALIEQLKSELEETKKIVEMKNAELDSLQSSIQNSREVIDSAARAQTEAVKARDIAESHCAGIEYELEALKTKFEKREAELLELLNERNVKSEESKTRSDNIAEKLTETEKELFQLQVKLDVNRADFEKCLKERDDVLLELRGKLVESMAASSEACQIRERLETTLNAKIIELEQSLKEKEEEYLTKMNGFEAKDLLINDLETKVTQLEAQLEQHKTRVTELENATSVSDVTIHELKTKNREFEQSIDKSEDQIRVLTAQITDLEAELKTNCEKITALRAEMTQFSTRSKSRGAFSEFFSHLSHLLGVEIVLEGNASICADDLAGDFTLSSTSNGTMIAEGDESCVDKTFEAPIASPKAVTTENPPASNAEIDVLRQELEQTRADVKELKKKHKALQAEYDETSTQLIEAIQDCDKLKGEVDKLSANHETDELSAKNSELQTQLDQATKQIENFNQELNELRSTLEKLVPIVAEKDKLDVLYQDLVRKSDDLTEELTTKRLEIESLKKLLEEPDTEKDVTEFKIQIDTLEKEAHTAKSRLVEKEQENQDLHEKIEVLQGRISAENAEKEKINEMFLAESQNVQQLTSELEEIQTRLEKTVNELNLVKSSLVDVETQLSVKSEEYSRVQTENDELLKKISEITVEKELLEREMEEEKASHDTKKSSLIAELTDVKRDLDGKCQDLLEKSQEVASLTETVETMKGQVHLLTNEKAALMDESSRLQSEFDEVSQRLAKVSEEKSETETRLEQKVTSLQLEVLEYLEKLNQKESQDSDVESLLAAAQNEIAQLRSGITELENQIEALTKEKETLVNEQKHEIELLRSNQTELVTQLEHSSDKLNEILTRNSELKTENSDLIMKLSTDEEKLALIGEQLTLLEPKYEQTKRELTDLQLQLTATRQEIATLRQCLAIKDQKLTQLEAEREQHTKDMFELDDLRKRTVKDRRSRRQSAHDELRPLVRSIKGVAVQTEPTDESCQCAFLNEKLEKQKIELLKAKVTADHYRLGNDQKVGDMREEKEKVERKLAETATEVARLVQEGVRLRKERENFRERLRKADAELKRGASRDVSSKETQTDISEDSQLYIKKLEDDLAIQLKKYQDCKKIAVDRRAKIREKEAEIAALKNSRSPEGGKENASNNIQISQLMNENLQLTKEKGELEQHYKHYKTLYQTKLQLSNKKQDTHTQTDPISLECTEDLTKLSQERDKFELKYRKAVHLFNISSQSLEEYKKNYVICAAENRALGTALSRYDKSYTDLIKPIDKIDVMYQEGYEDWKKNHPEFVSHFKLEK